MGNGRAFKDWREGRRWTQAEAGRRLGVSQGYIALLEGGKRRLSGRVARRAVAMLNLSPTALRPADPGEVPMSPDKLAREFATLGYPGFAYLRPGRHKNPAEVLVRALRQKNLEARLAEALPWVLLQYPDLDHEWLLAQARLANLSNRLGLVVDLARQVLQKRRGQSSLSYARLTELGERLRASRLDAEDTLCQESLSDAERNWLRVNRPEEAKYWHLLTDWRVEHLPYTI